MSSRTGTCLRVAGLFLALACGRQPPPGQGRDRVTIPADTVFDSAVSVDTPIGQRPTVRPGPPTAGAANPRPIPTPREKPKTLLSVAEVLDNPPRTGTVVSVRGTCLRRGAGLAQGGPPLTRSDWELGTADRAIWISGPRPVDCPVGTGATGPSLVRGLVQVDTLRMLDGTERPRVYLVMDQSR